MRKVSTRTTIKILFVPIEELFIDISSFYGILYYPVHSNQKIVLLSIPLPKMRFWKLSFCGLSMEIWYRGIDFYLEDFRKESSNKGDAEFAYKSVVETIFRSCPERREVQPLCLPHLHLPGKRKTGNLLSCL
jgi:hypothetical protein